MDYESKIRNIQAISGSMFTLKEIREIPSHRLSLLKYILSSGMNDKNHILELINSKFREVDINIYI